MISLALCMGTIGTALASPLYPIYQQLWHLLPSQITYIFVAYMFGCLATLLFFGRASNSFGFLRTLQVGLLFVITGLVLSAFASNALWLGLGALYYWYCLRTDQYVRHVRLNTDHSRQS